MDIYRFLYSVYINVNTYLHDVERSNISIGLHFNTKVI